MTHPITETSSPILTRAGKPLEAVLLDVDGTLVDTASILIRSLRHTLQKNLGGDYSDRELRNLLGRPLRKQMEHYCPEKAEVMSADFMTYYEAHQAEERPFSQALALLPWMRSRGLRVCLVTSKSAPEMVITRGRFPGLFEVDDMVTSDETARVKPHPDPALLGLKKLGARPDQAIMIGDSPYDIQCGHGAGVLVGSALWGPFPHEMLVEYHPDLWFSTPHDVQLYLENYASVDGATAGPVSIPTALLGRNSPA